MQRVKFTDDIDFSRIIYGMWRLGDDSDTSPAHVQRKIKICIEQGITTFDQADIYGDYVSETLLGHALKADPKLRDQMQIITKCDIALISDKHPSTRVKHYDTSAAHITSSVDRSLSNMNIDCIDMLLIHRPDPFMDAAETGAALDKLVSSGKVKGVGVSNFSAWDWDLLQSAMSSPLLTNQIEFSLTANDCLTNGDLAFLQTKKVPPMAWSPLGGGSLMSGSSGLTARMDELAKESGGDRAAVAVAWILAHPAGVLPVMGTNNIDRIAAISKACDVPMDRQTWFELLELARGTEVP